MPLVCSIRIGSSYVWILAEFIKRQQPFLRGYVISSWSEGWTNHRRHIDCYELFGAPYHPRLSLLSPLTRSHIQYLCDYALCISRSTLILRVLIDNKIIIVHCYVVRRVFLYFIVHFSPVFLRARWYNVEAGGFRAVLSDRRSNRGR